MSCDAHVQVKVLEAGLEEERGRHRGLPDRVQELEEMVVSLRHSVETEQANNTALTQQLQV